MAYKHVPKEAREILEKGRRDRMDALLCELDGVLSERATVEDMVKLNACAAELIRKQQDEIEMLKSYIDQQEREVILNKEFAKHAMNKLKELSE